MSERVHPPGAAVEIANADLFGEIGSADFSGTGAGVEGRVRGQRPSESVKHGIDDVMTT